jgi:tetratricopeptide (TPR) repeat protein
MALLPMERQAVALHDPRFRRPTLAKLLLLRAESELFDPGVDPLPTAELAAAVAAAVSQDAGGDFWQAAALAHWLLAKAQLAAREWNLADRSLRSMSAVLPDSEPSEERALAAVGRAQLAADRRDVDGATEQFLQAAYGFALVGSAESTGACQAELGLFLLDAGDLINARLSLGVALALLDAAAAPSLAARLHLALAEVATALNERARASEELARAQALYPLAPDGAAGPETLERRWREGRIAAAACDGARAAALLDEVRRELLVRGSLPEAARCTFDQVLLRIDARDSSDVGDLTGALAEAFPGRGEGWAEDMARVARLAADQPEAMYAPCWELRRRLRQEAFPEPGRPPLLRAARLLTDRVLRRRGELEDPIGAGVGL